MDPTALPNLPPWAIVGIIIIGTVSILPLGAAVLFIGAWVGRLQTSNSNLEAEVKTLRDRQHDLTNALSAYKQEVATEFVRHGALDKLESSLMDAIRGIGQRIDQALLSLKSD